MALTIRMRIDENDEHQYYYATGSGTEIELIPLVVTANGEYVPDSGKAYNRVTVNVPETELETLVVDTNGTYNAPDGTAYNVVQVNVQQIINLQDKSATYTANGNYTIQADSGYDGLGTVSVAVSVPTPSPSLQSKSVSYDTNGTYSVAPDTGYDGLSYVSVEVDVQGGGGVSNVDYGTFDTGLMTEGASNVLFQFRANESPLAFYIFSDDPMVASIPSGEALISFNGIANVNAGIPYDFFVAQSNFDGLMGDFNAYADDNDLSTVTVDGAIESNVIGCDTNNNVIGFVIDTLSPSGCGLIGVYHYVVVYPTVV